MNSGFSKLYGIGGVYGYHLWSYEMDIICLCISCFVSGLLHFSVAFVWSFGMVARDMFGLGYAFEKTLWRYRTYV